MGGPLQKLFTEFDSIQNSGCHGNEIEFFMQFFKNLLLWKRWSDFEIISQKCSLGEHTDMKKFLKNLLLRNCWSDFEIISQESGFDINRHCPIQAEIARGKLPSPFMSPEGKVKFSVCYCQLGSLLQILVVFGLCYHISKWILNCLQNSFKKNDPSKNMVFMEDSFSSYGTK